MVQNGKNISIGGNVSGNNNINTGDHATLINESQQGISEKAFEQLFKDINELCDGNTNEQMKFFAEKLQEAYQKEDGKEAKRLIGFLQGALGNIGSLASIASLFGLTL